jgi:integrase
MNPELPTPNSELQVPILVFSHHGINRTLVKHPAYVAAFKKGELSASDLKFKPWNLRFEVKGSERKFKLSPVDKDALRQAKDILNGQRDTPGEFAAWLSHRDSRRGITVGELAQDWRALKYPDHNGRPRTPESIANLEAFFTSALTWWAAVPAASADTKFAEFIAWRRAHSKRGNGERAADLELNTLSCLCRWAVFARKIDLNPFRGRKQGGSRPTFRSSADITHCYEAMPSSDEELHRILNWFFSSADPRRVITGAWLAWCALTGLRPGEPAHLMRHAALAAVPGSPKQLAPGTIFPTRDGKTKMKIHRLKRGQNPYVTLHPAAAEFLNAWNGWLQTHFPAAPYLFPNPEDLTQPLCHRGDKFLNGLLVHACVAAQAPHCKPHGFGRGYYVRVRRSQGVEDPTIAGELGQTTNGKLIRDTYGDPDDMVGGALFDWLPENDKQEPITPAWKLLAIAAPTNVVNLRA